MESPPELPPAKPPLGRRFYLLLLAPLVLMVLTACCLNTNTLATFMLSGTALATFVCSILLAGQIGRRIAKPGGSSTGMSILMFFAFQVFYGICFFIGCTAAVMVG